MPLKIQRIPAGLLNFLGIVGSGQTLRSLTDDVVPTLDVTPYYQQPDLDSTFEQVVAVAVGDQARVIVPPGESWKIVAYGGLVTSTVVGDVVWAYSGIGIENGVPGANGITMPTCVMPSARVVATAGEEIRWGEIVPTPLILPPGGHLMSSLLAPMPGSCLLQIRALFHRLRQ